MIAFLQLFHLLFGKSMDILSLFVLFVLLMFCGIIFDRYVFFEMLEAGENDQDDPQSSGNSEVSF